jgi:hypothetical protein
MKAQGDRNGKGTEVHTVNRNVRMPGCDCRSLLFLGPNGAAFLKCGLEHSVQTWLDEWLFSRVELLVLGPFGAPGLSDVESLVTTQQLIDNAASLGSGTDAGSGL